MAKIIQSIKQRLEPAAPLPPGVYQYQSPADDPLNYRLHLRLEADGSGLLIVNASTVLHLNATAAEYAYHLVQRTPQDEVAKQVASRYRVSRARALGDFANLKERIQTLITTPDLDPVTFLDFERHTPYSGELSAPYRLDCALTYRLPQGVDPQVAPTKRVDRELTTQEWQSIIDKAWNAGIPHILFTGGEPTERDDLAELIEHAERNGQVTGILTNGLRLSDANYLNTLLQAGLDHAMVILQPDEQKTWDTLATFAYWSEALDEDIHLTAHLTLTPANAGRAMELLDKLARSGVSAVSLSADSPDLSVELQEARAYADDLDLGLVWDLPVPYSTLNPVAIELEAEEEEPHPTGAARGWLYVEPDGDVLPAQGINKVLGNLLEQSWGEIWGAAKKF